MISRVITLVAVSLSMVPFSPWYWTGWLQRHGVAEVASKQDGDGSPGWAWLW